MEPQATTYRYLDYFAGVYRKCRCQMIGQNGKTAVIRLIDYGPKGKPPRTILRVHVKSLDLKRILDSTELSWHQYTDI